MRLNSFGVRLKLTQHCKLAKLHKKYILCLDMTIYNMQAPHELDSNYQSYPTTQIFEHYPVNGDKTYSLSQQMTYSKSNTKERKQY